MHTFWVTFYSYKGGVGRSMALANCAALLAQMGRRVLMIDFDLEAPGLGSFEEFQLPVWSPGLVEYVSNYLETGLAPSVGGYVSEVKLQNHISGKLWLMASGCRDEEYNRRRMEIDWVGLYEQHDGAAFFENFKADIEDTFKPDYVLVDSRTGLTDVGGVCTLQLPDLVVLLFALNEQNLQGIASVAKVLRESEKAPQMLPVATPVPNLPRSENSLFDQRYKRAEDLLGMSIPLSLGYSPEVALKEQIFAFGPPTPLTAQYMDLGEAIRNADPGGLDYLLNQAGAAIEAFDSIRANELSRSLEEEYADRVEAWLRISEINQISGNREGLEKALYRALELEPSNTKAFSRLNTLFRTQKLYTKSINLAQNILKQSSQLTIDETKIIRRALGESLMRASKAEEAVEQYRQVYTKKEGQREIEGLVQLPGRFNLAEAERRATGQPNPENWHPAIGIFERLVVDTNPSPLSDRLNILQAMHIAYACVGNTDRAVELLSEVEKLIGQVSSKERLFTVAKYDYVSKEEFLKINQEMRASLQERGQLWDGMEVVPRK